MAQINVYSPFNDLVLEGNSRVCINYERAGFLQVGVQRAGSSEDLAGHPSYEAGTGAWSELDRKGINDLIRGLREARDKAFGRDE